MPARPSGTGIDRSVIEARRRPWHGTSRRVIGAPTADRVEIESERRQRHQQDGSADHRRIGDVEHRPPADGQEVDDVPAQGSRRAEEPVDQVSHCAAQDHPQADGPPGRHQPATHPDDPDHDRAGDQRQHPRVAGGHRERGTGIAHQRPGHCVADDRHRLAGRQQLDCQHFCDDVQCQHHRRDGQQQAAAGGRGTASASAALSASVTGSADPAGWSVTPPSSTSAGTGHDPPRGRSARDRSACGMI